MIFVIQVDVFIPEAGPGEAVPKDAGLGLVDPHAVAPLHPLVGDRLAGRAGLVLKQVASSKKKSCEEANQYGLEESKRR